MRRGKDDRKRKEPNTRRPDYRDESRNKNLIRFKMNQRKTTPYSTSPFGISITPLNALIAPVLTKIKHEEFVKWPSKIKTNPRKRNKNKFMSSIETMAITQKIVFI